MNTLFKLLKEKKVADSYQFYKSCKYKLYFAETSCCALKNIINEYQEVETQIVNKVLFDASSTGIGTYTIHDNNVDYFGVQINVTTLIDKLTMEIMGLLHSFFDTFAQWLNAALLGEKALPIKTVTLTRIVKELSNYPEYAGDFISQISKVLNDNQYIYISDFNNTLKHRYQIYVRNRFDLLSKKGEVTIPNFKKDDRIHVNEDAIKVLEKSLQYCKKLFFDSHYFIEQYYKYNDCKYVVHRIYNPKTHFIYKSKKDYESSQLPQKQYYYIEVDPKNILDKYQIMLCGDTTEKEDCKNQKIECFNSPYDTIVLREYHTDNIVGILKPDDSDSYMIKDEHELIYRQYSSITSGYEKELSCNNEIFSYYPWLNPGFCVNSKQRILKTKIIMIKPAKSNVGLIYIVA